MSFAIVFAPEWRGRNEIMRRKASKRTTIAPRGSKRYIRRDPQGRIKKEVDVSRSLEADRRSKSKKVVKAEQGDRGDQAPRRKAAKKRTASRAYR